MIDTIWGSTNKPVASKQLSAALEPLGINGSLYIGYPIIGSPEGPFPIDALLLSPEKGMIVFHLVEGRELGHFEEIQDESYLKLQSKLLQHKQLSRGRELRVKISVLTFASALLDVRKYTTPEYPVCNTDSFRRWHWKRSAVRCQVV